MVIFVVLVGGLVYFKLTDINPNEISNVIVIRTKMVRTEKFCSQLGSKESKLPQLTILTTLLIGLKSTNKLQWLKILIKMGTNQFW